LSSYAQAITVSGSDVYTAGDVNIGSTSGVAYWKNTTENSLPLDAGFNADANCIYVLGSDVYVGGWESSSTAGYAVYWKNGTKVVVSTAGSGYGIFVK
jgi:hypothetical protein